MKETIRNFPKQFAWDPKIENEGKLPKLERSILAGMGGSGLPGDIVKMLEPSLELVVHKDYGLPEIPQHLLRQTLIIANSYSGNTEEPISAFEEGRQRGLPLAAISMGGRLLELARQGAVPFIQIPDIGIQPRMGLGFAVRALLKILGEEQLLIETKSLALQLSPQDYEQQGKELALKLKGKIPVIYSSQRNATIAFVWKLKFTETGKIPAFWNVFPELNHSEMNGFDPVANTKPLIENFAFIFLTDIQDHQRIKKRMEVLEQLYRARNLSLEIVELQPFSLSLKIFSSFLLADWTSYYTARMYGVDPEQVPMVEEFKKLISG